MNAILTVYTTTVNDVLWNFLRQIKHYFQLFIFKKMRRNYIWLDVKKFTLIVGG